MGGVFSPGWVGVDFFFVLSGFIIFFAHHTDLQDKKNVKVFFKKRFIRIFPIYWIAASIYLFFLIVGGRVNLIVDYFFIIKSYLLIPQWKPPFLWIAWSLIYECLFYLIFGMGIKIGLKIVKYLLYLWAFIIFISCVFVLPISNLLVFNNYILEFFLGCIIGYQFVYHREKYSVNPMILIYVGFALLIGMWTVTLTTSFGSKGSLESRVFYGGASALIIFGAALYNSKKQIKMRAFLLLLGDASYSLYLIHLIVLGVAYKISSPFLRMNESFVSLFGIIVAFLALFAGVLFHLVIEKRIINLMNKWMLPKRENKIA